MSFTPDPDLLVEGLKYTQLQSLVSLNVPEAAYLHCNLNLWVDGNTSKLFHNYYWVSVLTTFFHFVQSAVVLRSVCNISCRHLILMPIPPVLSSSKKVFSHVCFWCNFFPKERTFSVQHVQDCVHLVASHIQQNLVYFFR